MNLTSFLSVKRASFVLAVKTEIDSLSNPGFRFRWHSRLLNYLRKKKKRRAGRKWNRDQGDKQLRLAYDLGPESVVLDCGAYLGNFAAEIVDRYQCEVFCFEPVSRYFAQLSKRFADRPRVACLNCGIGSSSREAKIKLDEEASSVFQTDGSQRQEMVRIMGLDEALQRVGRRRIDLLKLNIEGGEFELLESILERNLQTRFKHIQVQFHQVVPDFHGRWLRIRTRLARSHRLTYDYYFVWESWSERSPTQDASVGHQ